MKHGLEQIFGAAAAGGLGGLHFADFSNAGGEFLLERAGNGKRRFRTRTSENPGRELTRSREENGAKTLNLDRIYRMNTMGNGR